MKNQNKGIISEILVVLLMPIIFVGVLILDILPYALLLGGCAFAISAGIFLGKKIFGGSGVAEKSNREYEPSVPRWSKEKKGQDVEVSKEKEDLDETIINDKVKQNDLVKENANLSDENNIKIDKQN